MSKKTFAREGESGIFPDLYKSLLGGNGEIIAINRHLT